MVLGLAPVEFQDGLNRLWSERKEALLSLFGCESLIVTFVNPDGFRGRGNLKVVVLAAAMVLFILIALNNSLMLLIAFVTYSSLTMVCTGAVIVHRTFFQEGESSQVLFKTGTSTCTVASTKTITRSEL